MALIIPTGFCQITIHLTNLVQKACVNVIGVANGINPVDQSDADDFSAAISDAYKAKLSTVSSYDGIRILIGDGTNEPAVVESTDDAGTGERSEAHCPPQVQSLIRKNTALSGRKNIGRMFLPDVLEANVNNNGTLNGTELAVNSAVMAAVFTACGDGPFNGMALLHSDNSAPTEVTSVFAESQVATLRKRYDR